MTIRAVVICLIVLGLPSLFAQTLAQSDAISKTIKVGFIKNKDSFLDGGGCSLQLPTDYKKHNERYIFLSDVEDHAVINIEGKDTKLKLVSRQEPKGEPKRGDRSKWIYAGNETKVQVDFVVTGGCDPNDEGCEVIFYDATITVTRDQVNQVIRVKGVCGS